MLSKTRFQHGVVCRKRMWLDAHRRDLGRPPDAAARLRLGDGHKVGRIARERFPAGTLVTEPSARMARAVARTRLSLDAPSTNAVFEGAFEHDGLRVRADVLRRDGTGFELIEVKSSLTVRDDHIRDLAVQAYVIDSSGVELTGASLLHLNPAYRWAGGLYDPQAMFCEVDLTAEVFAMLAEIRATLPEFERVLAAATAPAIDMGPQCLRPGRCAFFDHCQRTGGESAPVGYGSAAIPRWRAAPPALSLPLTFVDVQRFSTSLPRVVGSRPHERLPYAWALRTRTAAGDESERSFVVLPLDADPGRSVVESLRANLPAEGRIVMFSEEIPALLDAASTVGEDRGGAELAAELRRRAIYVLPLLETVDPKRDSAVAWSLDSVAGPSGSAAGSRAFETHGQAAAAYVEARERGTASATRSRLVAAIERYVIDRLAALVHVAGRT